MKPRFLLFVQAIILLLVAVFAGSATGTLVPMLSGTHAEAADLDVTTLTPLAPVGGGFTYQGRLKNGGNPASGSYDFTFKLYDAPTLGNQVGSTISPTIAIADGLFTTALDFGAGAFQGDARYLEMAVRPTGGGGYTALSPRQPITPAPYALFALDTLPYDNVVVVAKSGGDFTEIQAALNSIIDSSSANRYLVWVGPGIYSEQVTMKPYVDIEGAGEATTRITWTGASYPDNGTLIGTTNAELRSLTVQNTGGDAYAIAIYNVGASPSLLNVTVNASGGTSMNFGMHNMYSASPTLTNVKITASGGAYNRGMYNYESSPTMRGGKITASAGDNNTGVLSEASSVPVLADVKITASGASASNRAVGNNGGSPILTNVEAIASGMFSYNTAVLNTSASPRIQNSIITASGGTSNIGIFNSAWGDTFTVTVDNSTITGSSNTVYSDDEFTMRIGATKMAGGPVSTGGGVVTCAGVYNENYVFFAGTCP